MKQKRQQRKYSLFVRDGKSWVRLSGLGLPINSARNIFQNALLGGSARGLNMRLRQVDGDDLESEVDYKALREKYFGA